MVSFVELEPHAPDEKEYGKYYSIHLESILLLSTPSMSTAKRVYIHTCIHACTGIGVKFNLT